MVVALLVSGISDTKASVADTSASIADTSIRDNEVATTVAERDNSDSANATITITMYALPDE